MTNIEELVKTFKLDPNIIRLFLARGLKTEADIENFLNQKKITDSALLSGMKKSVDRIVQAINNNEKIVVCGDYDVDGTVSVAMFHRFFKEYGYEEADYYVPHRIEEGYGISAIGVEALVKKGAQLLISVDNGIAAFDAGAKAKELGVDLIITDHHDPVNNALPESFAIINPKLDEYKNCRYLSGASVAFYLINELNKALDAKINLKKYLVLAAIASIADVVPLLDDNRVLVKSGLKMLDEHGVIGLHRLITSLGLSPKSVTAKEIGYKVGPILNASGRLEGAQKTIELLIEDDHKRTDQLIKDLKELNMERRKLSEKATEDLAKKVNEKDKVIVVAGTHHQGISGIVASRLKAKFNRPVIVISFDEMGYGKASARSVPGFNIKEAIEDCKKYHLGGGGHYMAAGFSIREDQLDDFIFSINSYAALMETTYIPPTDLKLDKSQISYKFIQQLSSLEPFGAKFEVPLVEYTGKITMKKILKEAHLLIKLDNEVSYLSFFKTNIDDYKLGEEITVKGEMTVNYNKLSIIGGD